MWDKEYYQEILDSSKALRVETVRLQFTDIFGIAKNVTIPAAELPKALEGEKMFDGSSIDGFARIEESDMYLIPDPTTFKVFPEKAGEGVVARLICDIHTTNKEPFVGCPRLALKKVVQEARDTGYEMFVGSEAEFFLFHTDDKGTPTLQTHDRAGYFDLSPTDPGENARRNIVLTLEEMGYKIESSHHEASPGQHEINIRYSDALAIADQMVSLRILIKSLAQRHGLQATFMAKPRDGLSGSGMHYNQSLFRQGKNAFYAPQAKGGLSETALHYLAGILKHAPGFTAVTNPTINSYKRMVTGFHAPVYISWSERNRSSLVRIPSERGENTRVELRSPDPTSNPYLALAMMLKAGLEGIGKKIEPPPELKLNLFDLTPEEQIRYQVQRLPRTLPEALKELDEDMLMRGVLGEHIYTHFREAKFKEWERYHSRVHPWELEEYLARY